MRNPVGSLQPVSLHPRTLAQYQFRFKTEYRGIWDFIKYYPLTNGAIGSHPLYNAGNQSTAIYTYANIYIYCYIYNIIPIPLRGGISRYMCVINNLRLLTAYRVYSHPIYISIIIQSFNQHSQSILNLTI